MEEHPATARPVWLMFEIPSQWLLRSEEKWLHHAWVSLAVVASLSGLQTSSPLVIRLHKVALQWVVQTVTCYEV